MQDVGTSAPVSDRNGRGRRFISDKDHQVIVADHQDRLGSEVGRGGQGRKAFHIDDHVKNDVWQPIQEITSTRPPTQSDMKEALKEWLVEAHGMMVVDERRWDDAVMQQHGSNWKMQALNEQRRCLHREARTARDLAEKFAMMPTAELRNFGVRFAGKNEIAPQSVRREKKLTLEENPTLSSPGVDSALGHNAPRRPGGSAQLSTARKHPEDVQRRYIASGKDHFESVETAEGDDPGAHGHAKDQSFMDGLPRGIGHGKRRLGTKDQLLGATLTGDQRP